MAPVVLAGGVLLSLAANLAQAQPTAWGRIVAAVPPAAFLVAVSMIERRTARGPRPIAGQDGAAGEPSALGRPSPGARCRRPGPRRAGGRRLDRHCEGVATYRDGLAGHGPAGSAGTSLAWFAAGPPAAGAKGRRPSSPGRPGRSAELADRLSGFANLSPFHVAS